ncbi:hypothetical protein Tsubulata_002646 [Turnera subulata]|uniref:Tafazzin family protein n=1 Tax=Turnera subulata TaxID=218843 RepID=A0A9Q0GAI0_9ROSI|nr:hypothetical protein Tsubulata_002646 [Turnera subulata]
MNGGEGKSRCVENKRRPNGVKGKGKGKGKGRKRKRKRKKKKEKEKVEEEIEIEIGIGMEWAARGNHMGGIPRKMVFMGVGAFAKTVSNLLNTTCVHNPHTLLRLVNSRPPGLPLITVSNHMSTLDDPLMWGFKGFPVSDSNLARWVLAAEDICFKNPFFSYFFRLGKCIPITRGGGIYQPHMDEALQRLSDGEWLHTFPEGKVSQEDAPIRRLKWGTASLIVRAPVTPIVLPIVHRGFEEVMPEKYWFGRRPPLPLWNKSINIFVGEPIEFDLPKMKQAAISMSRNLSLPKTGWPSILPCGLDEASQRCLYSAISDQIHSVLENLRVFGNNLLHSKALKS